MPPTRPDQQSKPLHGILWALGSALGSALFMIPWKLATHYGEARHAVLVLLTSAALMNTLVLLAPRSAATRRWSPTALGLSIALAFLTLIGNEASAAAIARISGPLLSVLQRFEIIVVGLLAWIFLSETMTRSFWLGAGVASIGVVLAQDAAASTAHASGVLYGLVAAAAFGSMVVLTRRFIASIDVVAVNALRLWLSVLCWIGVHRELPTPTQLPLGLLINGSLAAIVGPFLGRLLLMQSVRHVEAPIAALCILSAPVATLALSWMALGDVPSKHELVGGAIILAGLAVPVVAAIAGRGSLRRSARAPG